MLNISKGKKKTAIMAAIMVVLKEGISGEEAVDMMNWIVMQLREQRDRRHIILDIRAYMRSH